MRSRRDGASRACGAVLALLGVLVVGSSRERAVTAGRGAGAVSAGRVARRRGARTGSGTPRASATGGRAHSVAQARPVRERGSGARVVSSGWAVAADIRARRVLFEARSTRAHTGAPGRGRDRGGGASTD